MNAMRLHVRRLFGVVPVISLAALVMIVPARAAQEADGRHPAHIHAGTCEELGDVVVPLADVAPIGTTGAVGATSALPVKVSVNQVDMPLQEIIDGGHAINVHKSAEEIDVYIACGAIGGIISDDGLVVGLKELNDSGHSGVAVLDANGDATDVTLYLVEEGEAGTSTAAQEAAPASADAQAVEIKSFAYSPNPIEVPTGGSIVWTNQDNVPHTTTAADKAILQSGAITSGNSFTQTFDAPGSYDYFCEFHPNMKGTIVVK